jgi:hypothetical protein
LKEENVTSHFKKLQHREKYKKQHNISRISQASGTSLKGSFHFVATGASSTLVQQTQSNIKSASLENLRNCNKNNESELSFHNELEENRKKCLYLFIPSRMDIKNAYSSNMERKRNQ